jgi:hypothetical protein
VNFVYEAIEDAIIASLESGPWLPARFELTIEDVAFQQLTKGLVIAGTSKRVDPKMKRVTLRIQERHVTIRSDRDPEPWLPITREDSLH